jgi:hypothetical protein
VMSLAALVFDSVEDEQPPNISEASRTVENAKIDLRVFKISFTCERLFTKCSIRLFT